MLRAPRPCSHYPLSGCCGGVELRGGEGGDGGDWPAKPTSPVDSEQMGPDSFLTHQCQGYFGLLQWQFRTGVYSNDGGVLGAKEITEGCGQKTAKVDVVQGGLIKSVYKLVC